MLVDIRHARDNKIHVWTRIEELPPSARLGGSAAQPGLPVPTLCYSMDVNALNYCRFSLLRLSPSRTSGDASEDRALIALPNLVESSVVCILSRVSSWRSFAYLDVGRCMGATFMRQDSCSYRPGRKEVRILV